MSKQIVKKKAEKPTILDQKPPQNRHLMRPNAGPLAHRSQNELASPSSERAVAH